MGSCAGAIPVTCGPELRMIQMLQMQSCLLILVLPSLLQALDTVLRAEIAAAAAESRNLASELAAMLLRLEGGDQGIADDGEDIIDDGENIIDDGEEIINDSEDIIDNGEDIIDDGEDIIDDGEDILDEEEEIVDDGEDKKDIEDSIDNSVDLSDVGEDMTDAEGVKHKSSANKKERDEAEPNFENDKHEANDILELLLGSDSHNRTTNGTVSLQIKIVENETDIAQKSDKSVVLKLENSDKGYFKEILGPKEKEERRDDILKSSLNKLEKVAIEIEKLARSAKSEEEIAAVHQLTQILEEMASALTLEEVRLSVDVTLSKEEKISSLKESVDHLLEYLREVMNELKEQTFYNENFARENKRVRKPKFLDEEEISDGNQKKMRQAKYRNMLTKFYFGSYWNYE